MILAFDTVGSGPPLVIAHGLFGSKRNWRSIASKLADRHTVITLDLRNHGESPHAHAMNYALLADDLAEFFDHHDLHDVNLIGHSMGGKCAMTYALNDGTRIARLIIVDIAPRAYVNEYGEMLNAMRSLDLPTLKRRSDAQAHLKLGIPDPGVCQFILQNLKLGSEPHWQINLPAIEANIDALVGAIPVAPDARYLGPCFCLAGALSDRVGSDDADELRQFFPQNKISSITAAAHWPHAENPDGFMAALNSILE